MVPPIEVSGSAKVQDLASQLRGGGAKAFVVREGADEFGVLLPEHLLEFARDEDLEKMLIAADLARPAPTVTEGADVAALVEAMREDGTEATVVVDAHTGEPLGVVTKSALARAFLDWYESRPSLLSERPPAASVEPE